MVQWLRFLTSNAGGLGSSPGQGTRSYMPQLRPGEYIHFLKKKKRIKHCRNRGRNDELCLGKSKSALNLNNEAEEKRTYKKTHCRNKDKKILSRLVD